MDRALDDIIGERKQQRSDYASRDRRPRPPRDGVRKPAPARRDENRNIDADWVHDRYNDNDRNHSRGPHRPDRAAPFPDAPSRPSPQYDVVENGCKIRIDNLHYELTEEDIRELFTRKGRVENVQLLYDRSDRSRGIAYVVMSDYRDARDAVRDYDGANANNQPIRVAIVPSAPSGKPRNPFDHAERPSRSLFDRVEKRSRSESPQSSRPRRSDTRGGAPDHVDRYVPRGVGGGHPGRRDDSRRGAGRRPGERTGTSRTDGERGKLVGGRPRKTQEELDAEMEDYWGKKDDTTNGASARPTNSTADAPALADGDVDMIE